MEKERGRNVKEKKRRAEEESPQESGRGRFIQQIQKTELFIFVHEWDEGGERGEESDRMVQRWNKYSVTVVKYI